VVSDKPTPPKPVVAAVPHDQASPPEPPSLADRASAVRDRVINYLVRPRDTGTGTGAERILTQEDPIAYAGRTGVGSVASMVMHPYDSAKAFARQAAEAPTALASSFMTDKMLQQAKAQGYDTSRIEKARADTLDQLKSMGHEITHDPARFVGEQVAQALFFHALGVGAGKITSALTDAAKSTALRAGKGILDVGPVDTIDTIRTIAQENADKLKATAKADADAAQAHLDKVRSADNKATKAEIDHAQSVVDVNRHNQRMLNRHQAVVNQTTDTNAALEHTRDLRTQRQAALDQQTAEYYAQEDATKARAKATERAAWKPWDQKMAKVEIDGGEIATPLQKITTKSPEMSRIINQLVPDPADVSPTSQFGQDRTVVMKSLGYGNDYWELPETKRGVVDQITKERGYEPEPIDFDPQVGQKISINDVQRAKSILGQHIASGRVEGVLLGEMKQVYRVLDQAVNKASTEAGAGADFSAAKEATKRYQRAFGRERHMPTTVDEAREKQANPEAFKARDDQARLDAAAVHDPTLVDAHAKVKAARAELDRMPTEEQLRKKVKQVPRPPSVGDIRGAAHQLKEQPKPFTVQISPPDAMTPPDRPPETDPNLTPSTVDEIKQRNTKDIQNKLRNYRKISTFRLAEMGAGSLGIISGIASIAAGALGATHGITGSLGGLSGGAFALALTPKLISHMINTPEIIAKLAAPTLADYGKFIKMPLEEQKPFKAAMTQLAKTAEKAGKLKKPSPWISFFANVATAAGAVNKPAREQQQKQDQQQQQQLDKDVMKDADEALRLANEQSRVTAPGNPAATAGRYLHTATHKQTGHRIGSNDNGRSWHDLNTGAVFNG
jgi:hypothetical protein